MAGTKVSALPAATVLADADLLPIVDVSDTTQAPTGTTKAVEAATVSEYLSLTSTAGNKLVDVDPNNPRLPDQVRRANFIFVDVQVDFGAAGDGVTDDTAAIQDAIDYVGAAGGGTVWFPAGTYRVSTVTGPVGGRSWGLIVSWDSVTLAGGGPSESRIVFESGGTDASLFEIGGWCKAARVAGDVTEFADYRVFDATVPADSYALTGSVARGARSITTNTAADAANFVAGDMIAIATGNLSSLSAAGQPDAELNWVRAVDGGTGAIDLVQPTRKSYAAENYASGSTGLTAVGGGGSAAPYLVYDATDRIMHDFVMRDLFIETDGEHYAIVGVGINGATFERLGGLCTGGYSLWSLSTTRRWTIRDVEIDHRNVTGVIYVGSPDTGSTDYVMENVLATTDGGILHLHPYEGSTGLKWRNVRLFGPEVATNQPNFYVATRAYDVDLDESCLFVGGGNTSAVVVPAGCGGPGHIGNVSIRNSSLVQEFAVYDGNWTLDAPGRNIIIVPTATAPGPIMRSNYLTGWLADDRQNVVLGNIPARSMVVNVFVDVTELFNSDGTDQVTVGYDALVTGFGAAVDVSTTGAKTVTLSAAARRYLSTSRVAEAYYTAGGSAPTTGKALIVVEYVTVPLQVT